MKLIVKLIVKLKMSWDCLQVDRGIVGFAVSKVIEILADRCRLTDDVIDV